MAYPVKPERDYSYTAFEESQGTSAFPGTELDNDLDNEVDAIGEIIDFIARVMRSDGALQNGIVTKASLAADVVLGLAPPRPWVTATEYAVDQTVSQANGLYICLLAHTSGTFSADLTAGRWALLAIFDVPVTINDGSVTEPKHATGGVSTRALADDAVTPDKIPDASIPRAKMAANVGLTPIGASIPFRGPIAPTAWAFEYGQALNRVTYAELFAVLAPVATCTPTSGSAVLQDVSVDFRNLGLVGAPLEGAGIPVGATVLSITATTVTMNVNANATPGAGSVFRIGPYGFGDGTTTFTLPDSRDYTDVGRGDMGGVAASRILTTGDGASDLATDRLYDAGGADRVTLTADQVPALTGSTSAAGAHGHTYDYSVAGSALSATSGPNFGAFTANSTVGGTTSSVANHTHTATVNSGGGDPHPNLQPSRVANKIIFTGVV